MSKRRRLVWIKPLTQGLFFLFVLTLVVLHYLKEKGINIVPSILQLHALCPFGAVETLIRLLGDGRFLPKTGTSNLWVLAAVILPTVVFGPLFCSRLCPLGTASDVMGKLGKKIFKKRYNNFIPPRIDRALGYLRYAVLGLIIFQTVRATTLAFAAFDPFYALFHFWTGEALPSAVVVLILFLAGSIVVYRPWCRWFCPLGAVLGIAQLIAPWKIRRNPTTCTACGRCAAVCPMRIAVDKKNVVLDTRCNRCGECISSCPHQGTLKLAAGGKKIQLALNHPLLISVLTVSLFALPLITAQTFNLWPTSLRSSLTQNSDPIESLSSSATLAVTAQILHTDTTRLKNFLGLPADMADTVKIRDLEDYQGDLTVKNIKILLKNFVP